MSMQRFNLLVAPNGFKDSMSATQAAEAITLGLREAKCLANIIQVPLADGGSGTVEALVRATGGQLLRTRVKDPLGRTINSYYGLLPDKYTAVIEMAAASGLALLALHERNPWQASSYGTGELIRRALAKGARRIILGIGDSATVDGGIGALQ
ncbi:MAG: glycerate kinase, partial [Acidobacteriota bacterium]